MVMTAAELNAWEAMSPSDQRAVRRRIAEEISRRDRARPPAAVIPANATASESVLLGARFDLDALERGDDELMGTPRHLVDFRCARASIDVALARTRKRAEYSAGISGR